MDLNTFISSVEPHGVSNSAPPKSPVKRHEWESKLLYSVYDCLGNDCCVLDYGCGSNGTLQHTLFNYFPNSTYYGLDLVGDNFEDSKGFKERKENNVHLLDIKHLDDVLPKADCMILGSVFTHLGLNEIRNILDKTLPYYDKGFQLGFSTFLGKAITQYYKSDNYDYWWIVVLTIKWIQQYCDQHNLNFIVHDFKFDLDHTIPLGLTYQNFITISK